MHPLRALASSLTEPSAAFLALLGLLACTSGGDGEDRNQHDPEAVAEPIAARLSDVQFRNTLFDVLGVTLTEQEEGWLPRSEVLPGRYQSDVTAQSFADEFVVGYARIARSVAERLDGDGLLAELAGCSDTGDDCLSRFVDALGLRLFRRPVTLEEQAIYLALVDAIRDSAHPTDGLVIEGLMQAMLQAPSFLYRLEAERIEPGVRVISGWELGARLASFLWLSAPDEELLEFAAGPAGDGVFDREALPLQVERMLADPRFERAIRAFWGDYSLVSTASFSTVPADTAEDLRASMLASFAGLSSADDPEPLSSLFDGTRFVLTGRVAELIDVAPSEQGLAVYDDVPDRLGLVTHPAFLAAIGTTSFVGRGTFLSERLLCEHVIAPPSDDDTSTRIEETELATVSLTPREASAFRFSLEGPCYACHIRFEPIAYAFERYDVNGRYTLTDAEGRALFSDGELPEDGERAAIPFDSAPVLLRALSDEPSVRRCLAENVFEFASGASARGAGAFLDDAATQIESPRSSFRDLVRAAATSPRLTMSRAPAE
ncbi:MAG: DUF1588 domain-containing protein [Myxococcales bacterium]|nr:DUF1588 domain-containing protein [Myxococcales bacterium]